MPSNAWTLQDILHKAQASCYSRIKRPTCGATVINCEKLYESNASYFFQKM